MREPGNPVDTNAVAVIRVCRGTDGRTELGELLGHSSKEISRDLGLCLDEGPVGFAEILEITGDLDGRDGGSVGVNIRAEEYMPADNVGENDADADTPTPSNRGLVA